MNLLVGGTGFVGGHVVEYLFQQGEISKGIFRKGSHLKILDANGVQVLEADLLDHHSLHEAMEGVDTVYNMASPMPDSDEEFHRINTEGLLNLLEAATEAKAKAFVQLSTAEVYGFGNRRITEGSVPSPSNDYQRSKAEAERILMEFSRKKREPKITIIRPAKAVGSRDDSIVIPLLRMAASGTVSLPQTDTMSFSHPKDIGQAMLKSATTSVPSGSVFLTKSFDGTMEQFARGVLNEVGSKAEIKKQGLFSASKFPRYATDEIKGSLYFGEQRSWGDIGFVPQFSLKATCEEIADWYRKEPWSAGAG